jgi:hypothetical protein
MKTKTVEENLASLFLPRPGNAVILKEDNELIKDEPKEDLEALEDDFQLARESISSLLETSKDTMKNLVELCAATDSPRAFEAISGLIASVASASKDLLSLHETVSKIKNQKESSSPLNQTNIQNNIVFKGSTKELLEIIKEQQ